MQTGARAAHVTRRSKFKLRTMEPVKMARAFVLAGHCAD